MKHVIYTITAVLLVAMLSIAANVAPTATQKSQPNNVGDVVFLHSSSAAASIDTFTASEVQTYGPYEATSASQRPMFKSFSVFADAITGTTPTMELYYQLTSGLTVSDSTASWTLIDTLDATAQTFNVDISAIAGKGIMFKVNNFDGTACQIPGNLKIMFKEDVTFSQDL